MPKKIVKGVGMMQRVSLQYDIREPGAREAWVKAWDAAIPYTAQPGDMPGDARDRENAARCRAIIAEAEAAKPSDGPGATEADREWIAAEWLAAYGRMLTQRAKLIAGDTSPNTIGLMLMDAQEMGLLQERMFWRADPDPQTGKRRERLAIGKQSQELSVPKASKARREKAAENEPKWWDGARIKAKEIRQRRPDLSRSSIAALIAENCWFEERQYSERQVRDVIKSVC